MNGISALKKETPGTSLSVHWLGLCSTTAGAQVQFLVGELRSRMLRGQKKTPGNSLVVQWLGLGVFTAVAWVQSLVRKLRSRKLPSQRKKRDSRKLPCPFYPVRTQ